MKEIEHFNKRHSTTISPDINSDDAEAIRAQGYWDTVILVGSIVALATSVAISQVWNDTNKNPAEVNPVSEIK